MSDKLQETLENVNISRMFLMKLLGSEQLQNALI